MEWRIGSHAVLVRSPSSDNCLAKLHSALIEDTPQKTDYFFNDLIIGFALHFASKVISNETAKDVLILLRKVVEMGKFTPFITSDAHPVHRTPEILGER